MRALYNWRIPEALDLINESLGINFTDGRASINEIKYIASDFYGTNQQYDYFVEMVIKSNVSRSYNLPKKVTAGLCEIVGGFDSSNAWLNTPAYGYGLLRYLAKNYSDGLPDGTSYNAKKTALTLAADYAESSPDLPNFASTVKNVNAKALKKDIKIMVNALNNFNRRQR